MMTLTARPGPLALLGLAASALSSRAARYAPGPADPAAETRAHRDLVVELIHRSPDSFASEMDLAYLLEHSAR